MLQFAGNRFVVLGRAGLDLFAGPVGTKSEDAEMFHADLGGSSANICVGLVKLGAEAALATSVSDDAVGRFCLNRLRHYGVETRYVRTIGGEYRTSLALYESRTEDFQNVLYRNGAADFQVTQDDIDQIDFSGSAGLITTGTVLAAEPSRSATFRAFEHARHAGVPIIFDVDYRPYSWASPEEAAEVLTRAGAAADMIVGNEEEFDFMAGADGQGLSRARALALRQGRIVIYKMGHLGAITFADGQEMRSGVFQTRAVKPVGAGDSFLAGLLAGLSSGHDLRTSVQRGSACAAITVSKQGCAPAMPDQAQLRDFLSAHADHPLATGESPNAHPAA